MGLFGKKKSKEAAGADYVDVETANEALPIAVAVFPETPSAMPLPSAPPASKDMGSHVVALPPQQQQQQAAQPVHLIISREPSPLQPCLYCGRNARTRVTTHPNWITWCLVGLLLFLFWPLFWLPVRCPLGFVLWLLSQYLSVFVPFSYLSLSLSLSPSPFLATVGDELNAKIGSLLQHVQCSDWSYSALRRLLCQTSLRDLWGLPWSAVVERFGGNGMPWKEIIY